MLDLDNFALDLVVLQAAWDGCETVGWVGGDGGEGAVGAAWYGPVKSPWVRSSWVRWPWVR